METYFIIYSHLWTMMIGAGIGFIIGWWVNGLRGLD